MVKLVLIIFEFSLWFAYLVSMHGNVTQHDVICLTYFLCKLDPLKKIFMQIIKTSMINGIA